MTLKIGDRVQFTDSKTGYAPWHALYEAKAVGTVTDVRGGVSDDFVTVDWDDKSLELFSNTYFAYRLTKVEKASETTDLSNTLRKAATSLEEKAAELTKAADLMRSLATVVANL